MTAPTLASDRLTLRRPDAGDSAAMTGFFAAERSRFHAGPTDEAQGWRDPATRIGHWDLRGYGMFAVDTENAAPKAPALRLGARPDPASPSPLPGCETYRHHPEHSEVPA